MSKIAAALTFGESTLPTVKVHPIAIFSILNNFSRRSDRDSRVIGTLLGVVRDGVVEVTDCFGFPHIESVVDGKIAVTLDVQMSQTMYACHRRVNKQEQIVGWYTTTTTNGEFITEYSPLIHDFYAGQCKDPILLVVDTTLRSDIDVRGFISQSASVDGQVLASVFDSIKVDLIFSDAEKSILYHIINGVEGKDPWSKSEILSSVPPENEQIIQSIEKALATLESLQGYVDSVVDGKVVPSIDAGIAISDALASFKGADSQDFKAYFQERSQDFVMISYLNTLVQAQVKISEKLQVVV